MSAAGRRIRSVALVALIVVGLVVPGSYAASAASTKTIVLTIDSTVATVAGANVTLDAAPFVAGGRTMLPVRFVAEVMGPASRSRQERTAASRGSTWDCRTAQRRSRPSRSRSTPPPRLSTVRP